MTHGNFAWHELYTRDLAAAKAFYAATAGWTFEGTMPQQNRTYRVAKAGDKPVAGVDQVLVPGDTERAMRAERTRNGVPLPDDTWAAIVNTAREVGVSEVSIQRATA